MQSLQNLKQALGGQFFFQPNQSQNEIYQLMGDHYLQLIITKILCFNSKFIKAKYKKVTLPSLEEILKLITQLINENVSNQSILMCFGKMYHQNQKECIQGVEEDLQFVLEHAINNKLPKLNNHINGSKSSLPQNKTKQQPSKYQGDQNQSSLLKLQQSQDNDQFLDNSHIEGYHSQIDILQNLKDLPPALTQLNISMIKTGESPFHKNRVMKFLDEIKNYSVQLNLLIGFRYKNAQIINLDLQKESNLLKIHTIFKIKYPNGDIRQIDGFGKGQNKQQAKQQSIQQILYKLFVEDQKVFNQFCLQKQKRETQLHQRSIIQYLKGLNYSNQLNHLRQFKFKDSIVEDELSKDGQNVFQHKAIFKIKHYQNNNKPKQYQSLGKGQSKQKAKEECYSSLLQKVYFEFKTLFEEFKDYKKKKGVDTTAIK